MRLQLVLNHPTDSLLPINYQHYVSSMIYKTLGRSAPEFAEWLHEHGFEQDGRNFKHFTFGFIDSRPYHIDTQRQLLQLKSRESRLTLSFWIADALRHFVAGLFQDESSNPQYHNN